QGRNPPGPPEARMPDCLEGPALILKLRQPSEAHPRTFEGRYYKTQAAVCTPPPGPQPHPPIWFGEAHPLTFGACARYGQGWNSVPVGLIEMKRRLAALRSACQQIGRDFSELEISYETQVLIAPSPDAVREKLKHMLAFTPPGSETPQEADFLAFVNGKTDKYPAYLTNSGL